MSADVNVQTPDLLAAIVEATRTRVEAARANVPARELAERASVRQPRGDAFTAALRRDNAVNVIAECKRRSPSRGVLRAAYDPVAIATGYARAGAAAISVLTEPTFFDGSLAHLAAVREAVTVPLLRKDFIIDSYQLLEAAATGADAVLLIVAALDDTALMELSREAAGRGLATLVEVHTEGELDRAFAAGAQIIGVNNRNLKTLDVDVALSERLAARFTPSMTAVSESGLRTSADLERFTSLGYRAFLIGERFMTAADPGEALAGLLAEVAP
jgi:indole-3-glycerol phosphate synthase